jgi:Tol biopolymer transport system component
VQWFERNRLELHPDNAPPYDVLLGRLGAEHVEQTGAPERDTPREGCRYFEETGFNVCGEVLSAWRAEGLEFDGQPGSSEAENLALFGLPLTGEFEATLADGNTYTVQWFERARFERHPENQPPYNVLLGLLGAEAEPVAQEPPVAPAGGGRIAFASNRDRPDEFIFDIYVMNADGSNVTRLTTEGGGSPAWSPDGNRIAFASSRNGTDSLDTDIYMMNADGSNIMRLTSGGGGEPAWSPDGSRIAFSSARDRTDEFNADIYVINADGTDVVRLTTEGGYSPTWSPDGSRIAFISHRDRVQNNDTDIYIMNADGSNIARLTSNLSVDSTPVWSPDGSRIAFNYFDGGGMVDGDIGRGQVYTIDADGSDLAELTPYGEPMGVGKLAWSPGGNSLVFSALLETSPTEFNRDIHIINADGTGLTRLTDHPAIDSQPVWTR